MALGDIQNIHACAVEVLELATGDHLAADRGAVGNVVNNQHNLTAAGDILGHLNHRGDRARLAIDDEEQQLRFTFGDGFDFGDTAGDALGLVERVLFRLIRDLRVVECDTCRSQ